jgi:hypothetical protein
LAIEINLKSPKKISRIRINPNIGNNLDLIQVAIEATNTVSANTQQSQNSDKYAVLTSPIRIKNSVDIDLPSAEFVKSFTLFFAQSSYTRTKITPLQSEVNTKLINQISSAIRKYRKNSHDKLQDNVIKFFIKDYAKDYITRNKSLYYYDYTDYYPTDYEKINVGVLEEFKNKKFFSDIDDFNKLKNTTLLSNIVFSIVSFSIGSKLRSVVSKTYLESNLREAFKNVSNYSSGGIVPLGDSNKSENNSHFLEDSIEYTSSLNANELFSNSESPGMYEYMFSIKNISFFSPTEGEITSLPSPLNRSMFVSKRIPIGGLPMKVKMMSEYFSQINYSENDISNDKTSIEFSVSITDNPIFEENWIPIMPFNDSEVRAELLYPNLFGVSSTRFLANEESVKLFENGKQRNFGTYEVSGKNISILQYNSSNTYFVSYVPFNISALKEVPLFSRSMSNPVLVGASSNGFNGERFEGSGPNNSVTLSNTPYISQEKLVNAVYSSINGTITTNKSSFGNFDYSSYSPVKVIFEDGSVGLNLSNYILSSSQSPSFYETDSILFVHSANTIIFNQKINKPFRVIYQYIPSIFRYRIVLRSLNNSPENYSVDRLLFKFSLDKDNTIDNNFLKYDNKYLKKSV